MDDKNKQFEGFRKPEKPDKNFYHVPNEWTDITAEITNLAELKVIEYIMRHTWGFKEYGKLKKITTDEFMHGRKLGDGTRMDKGTGLSNRSVIDGLRAAIEHGYAVCETDKRGSKSYGLKMKASVPAVKNLHSDDCEDSSQDLCNIFTDTVNNPHSNCEESSQTLEKETRARHLQKNTRERKNDTHQQKSNITTHGESSHSSDQSSFSSSQEKVTLTPDEQRIIEFGKKILFKAKLPKVTEKLKNECAELAPHIETQEQFDSLLDHVKAKLKPPYHLKNMVNALNGWLQIQAPVTEPLSELSSDPVITDEELADDVWKFVQAYQADDNFDFYLQEIRHFKAQSNLTNYDVYTRMIEARKYANPERSNIDDFMYELQSAMYVR